MKSLVVATALIFSFFAISCSDNSGSGPGSNTVQISAIDEAGNGTITLTACLVDDVDGQGTQGEYTGLWTLQGLADDAERAVIGQPDNKPFGLCQEVTGSIDVFVGICSGAVEVTCGASVGGDGDTFTCTIDADCAGFTCTGSGSEANQTLAEESFASFAGLISNNETAACFSPEAGNPLQTCDCPGTPPQ